METPTRTKSYLFSKRRIADPLNPRPEEIHIVDIAQGLTNETRFAGQKFISVAEHSLEVEWFTRIYGGSLRDRLYALLHDAAEAYLGDLPSWAKKACPDYSRLEKRYIKAIMKRYGLSSRMPAIVKKADDGALSHETLQYFDLNHPENRDHIRTKSRFLDKFNELYWEVLNDR